MKKQLLTTGSLILLLAGAEIHAEGQHPDGFKLKNRSTFSSAGREHDPFWPIGWVKPASVAASSAQSTVKEVQFTPEGLAVTSILMGQPALAVINGREYAEGETIPCEMGGQRILIQLAAVQDGFVVLRYLDRNYTVQMHRKGEDQHQIARTEEAQLPQSLR